MLSLEQRLQLLSQLGDSLATPSETLDAVCRTACAQNSWFTPENVSLSLLAIRHEFLDAAKLQAWVANYNIPQYTQQPKTIGLVLAGNLPLVGFHDILCVFVSGNRVQVKLSEKDAVLFPYLLSVMTQLNPAVSEHIEVVENLHDYDAVIATGSNNSARYFELYFSKVPHIIRRNRNSVAIIDGQESDEDLRGLGWDVFRYFGLGCRNVSKVYVPRGYDLTKLMAAFDAHADLAMHNKYRNNYDYNHTLYLLNKVPHLINDCVVLVEDKALTSRIGCLHYEYYDDLPTLQAQLVDLQDNIQCIVSRERLTGTYPFGRSQEPGLADYADNVDTMTFLLGE